VNTNDERARGAKWGGDFKRPRNDDFARWDAAERELAEVCADPETRAAFLRVSAVATALGEVNSYVKNPDGDCHIANEWAGESFGDDIYDISRVIVALVKILAMKAAGAE